MTKAETRIRDIFSSLYLSEPLYQMVSLSHKLVEDKTIETIGVWQKELHYNPDFIDELSDINLKEVLFNELDRILLRHPYERKKKNAVASFRASNLTLAEHGRNLGQTTVKDLYEYIQLKGYSEDQGKFMKLYSQAESLSEEELLRRTGFTHEKLARIVERIKLPELDEMTKRHMEYYYNLLDKYLETASGMDRISYGDNDPEESEGPSSEEEDGEGSNKDKEGDKDSNSNGDDEESKEGKDESEEQESGEGEDKGEDKVEEKPKKRRGRKSKKNEEEEGDDSDPSAPSDDSSNGKGKGGKTGMDRYNNPVDPGKLSEKWDEDPIAENEIENAIREAQITGQWGSVGGKYQETLLASLKPKVNYKNILRKFRQRVLSSNTSLNRMRPNRRFGFGFPGRKHEYTTKLAFFIDTSASVGDKALADCFGTINNIFSYGIQELDCYFFDTEIQSEKPLTISKAQKDYSPSGRGGTDFQSVFNFLEKDTHCYDGIIVFTDGECYVPDLKGFNPSDVCWLIDNEAHYNVYKGGLSKVGRVAFVESSDEEV